MIVITQDTVKSVNFVCYRNPQICLKVMFTCEESLLKVDGKVFR